MVSLKLMAHNLERQHALYADLEAVLADQQSALLGREIDRLESLNQREAVCVGALGAAEAERQGLIGSIPVQPRRLSDLVDLAGDAALRERLLSLAATLPPLIQRVVNLARTNRVLAADGSASCRSLLRLLGFDDGGTYTLPAQAPRTIGACLRLDVTA